MNTAITQ